MTVSEMLQKMSSQEITNWVAYFEIKEEERKKEEQQQKNKNKRL